MPKITVAGGPSIAGDQPDDEPAEQAPAAEEQSDTKDYSSLTYGQVQAACKIRGLPATGSHLDLINRLVEDDQRARG